MRPTISGPHIWWQTIFYAEYYAGYDAGHREVMSVPHVLLTLLSEGPKCGQRHWNGHCR